MMKLQNHIIFGLCAVFMIINSAYSLKCYKCSTDAAASEFCRDPFNKEKLTILQQNWTHADCKAQTTNFDTASQFKPVCKKLVQKVNNVEIIKRSCYFQDIHEPHDFCYKDSRTKDSSIIKTEFCETCDTDFCNNAGVYAPIFTLVLLPALIAKVFSL